MKQYLKLFAALFIFSLLVGNVDAQTKVKIKTKAKTAAAPKFTEQSFGNPSSVSDVTDISDSNKAFSSVKNLLDKHVTLTYQDNTFRGSEPIRRGDFVVALNSSLDALNKVASQNGIESGFNGMNTTSNTTATAASVADNTTFANNNTGFTDVPASSVYYSSMQSLMSKGVTMPFTDSKKLNAGAPMTEEEVYNALNQVFGYDKSGMDPYTKTMSRDKFAMVLNNAVSKKLMDEYAMIDKNNAAAEQMKQQQKEKQAQEMASQDQMRKDSMNTAYKAEQMEIERKALEAQSKKKHKK